MFDGIYKKLERELHEKKNEMAAIVEESHAAYHARDKAQVRLQLLHLLISLPGHTHIQIYRHAHSYKQPPAHAYISTLILTSLAILIYICMPKYPLQKEMTALKVQAEREQAQFEDEWRELGKLIEEDRHTKEALKRTAVEKMEEEHRCVCVCVCVDVRCIWNHAVVTINPFL